MKATQKRDQQERGASDEHASAAASAAARKAAALTQPTRIKSAGNAVAKRKKRFVL